MIGGDNLSVRIDYNLLPILVEGVETTLEFETLSIVGNPRKRATTVHSFKRCSNGKTYVSPRLILSSQLNNLIGKKYKVFRSKAVLRQTRDGQEESSEKGTAVVLFFPDLL